VESHKEGINSNGPSLWASVELVDLLLFNNATYEGKEAQVEKFFGGARITLGFDGPVM
jgi:hypothetical protein